MLPIYYYMLITYYYAITGIYHVLNGYIFGKSLSNSQSPISICLQRVPKY